MMKKNKYGLAFLCVPLLFGVQIFCQSLEVKAQTDPELAVLEEYLRSAEIVHVEEGADLGTTDPWNVQLDDGKTKKRAIFKHAPRCRPNPIMVDCYKYEIAAYELSNLMGLPIVPPTVERTVHNTPGALQVWLVGSTALNSLESVSDTEQFHRSMLDILVFDNLTYCATEGDDINEDIFYHNDDGRICRVDFSKAFEDIHELLPKEREVTQCSERAYRALEQLDASEVRTKLAAYLNEDEIEALLVRRDLLLAQLSVIK